MYALRFPSPYGEKVSGKGSQIIPTMYPYEFPSPYGEKVSGKFSLRRKTIDIF